jgi:hypothetical protein
MSTRTGSRSATAAGPVRPHSLWLRTVADLLRVGGLASLAWSMLDGQWVDAALFALVMLGVVLPRLLRTQPVLDVVSCLAVLFAAWSAVLNLYVTYDWLDVVVHAIACGLITAIVHRMLVSCAVLPGAEDRSLRWSTIGVVVVFTALGLGLGVVWEMLEWFGHAYVDARIQVGYNDTIGDLAADGLGALATGLLVLRSTLPTLTRTR